VFQALPPARFRIPVLAAPKGRPTMALGAGTGCIRGADYANGVRGPSTPSTPSTVATERSQNTAFENPGDCPHRQRFAGSLQRDPIDIALTRFQTVARH